MRSYLKNNILEVFTTLCEANEVIKDLINKKDHVNAQNLMADCQEIAIEISDAIEESEGVGFVTASLLEEYCKSLYELLNSFSDEERCSCMVEQLEQTLDQIGESLNNDIKVRREIVFFPYKASMWDSMDSIWKAASEDPSCDVYVVPIPYYDRNPDFSLGAFHYEGGNYPKYVPVVHYEDYDIENRCPDVVYIHNPYDGYNYVTSVDPGFYSDELKKYTDLLVYVPYHISGHFPGLASAPASIAHGMSIADMIIVQSENMKNYYAYGGVPARKLAVLGSPKTDYTLNELNNAVIPSCWMDKLQGKKVILLNTSISDLLNSTNWSETISGLIGFFEESSECVMIWRPHPLLRSTVASMRLDFLAEYDAIVARMENSNNIIVDDTPSAYSAMKACDAMISDYSSLMMQLTLTGKPTLLMYGSEKDMSSVIVNFDFFGNYFVQDGCTVGEFVQMVINGQDEKREERLRRAKSSIANTDGSCGAKIHEYVIKAIECN